MKQLSKFIILLNILLFSFSSFAQDVDQDEMMKAWQKAMTPGPEHEMLANMVGEWDGDITMWMDSNQPPETSKGTAIYESIYDGRYIIGKYSGTAWGMPMNGMDINGYDNVKKVFFSTWIDNMGTGLMYSEGTYDEESKTINFTSDTVGPMGNKMKVRSVTTLIDKDHTQFEMFMDMGSGEMKSMEIKYTRK
jgi:hypothetical protein